MGSQKLGLGPDPSLDSEGDPEPIADVEGLLFNSRLGWLIVPFLLAVLCFVLLDWAGYQKVAPWNPKPLAEIWWHFPVWFVLVTVVFRFVVFLDKRF